MAVGSRAGAVQIHLGVEADFRPARKCIPRCAASTTTCCWHRSPLLWSFKLRKPNDIPGVLSLPHPRSVRQSYRTCFSGLVPLSVLRSFSTAFANPATSLKLSVYGCRSKSERQSRAGHLWFAGIGADNRPHVRRRWSASIFQLPRKQLQPPSSCAANWEKGIALPKAQPWIALQPPETSSRPALPSSDGVDILVANHGIWPPEDMPVDQMTDEQWRRTVAVNLDSVFGLVKHSCRLP